MDEKEYWEILFPGDGPFPKKIKYRYTVIEEAGRYYKEEAGYDEPLRGDEVFLTEQAAWERIVQNAEKAFDNAEANLLKTVEAAEKAGWERK